MARQIVAEGILKLDFNPNEILYHGTLDIYGELLKTYGIKIITRTKNGVDFGPGFYLTVGNEEQAINWAKTKAQKISPPNIEILDMLGLDIKTFLKIKNDLKPVIVKYKIKNPESWLQLRHILFNKNGSQWQNHVWQWRQAEIPPEQYDWVFGPVADGGIYEASHHFIKAFKGQNQLSIHNSETAELLEFLEVKTC